LPFFVQCWLFLDTACYANEKLEDMPLAISQKAQLGSIRLKKTCQKSMLFENCHKSLNQKKKSLLTLKSHLPMIFSMAHLTLSNQLKMLSCKSCLFILIK